MNKQKKKSTQDDSVERLQAGAVKSLKRAVKKAIDAHIAAGVPAAIWHNGKLAYIVGKRSKGKGSRYIISTRSTR